MCNNFQEFDILSSTKFKYKKVQKCATIYFGLSVLLYVSIKYIVQCTKLQFGSLHWHFGGIAMANKCLENMCVILYVRGHI